mgnify:CR=1 FL=1
MAGDSKKLQPIIVKKIKRGGHGHHGGAWKIAYADFVTAMMAFFLLMWLLGSTTEGDKKGIADYFSSPMKVAMFGGAGSGDASHVLRGGGQDLTRTTGQVKRGDVESERKTINLKALKEEQIRAEIARLRTLQRAHRRRVAEQSGLGRVPLADPAGDDARWLAHSDHRCIEPADVRQWLGTGATLHAGAAARDRRGAGRGAQPPHARGPYRCHAVFGRRARLQQLGAVGRPRQRVAPRAAGPAACPTIACCACRAWRPASCSSANSPTIRRTVASASS